MGEKIGLVLEGGGFRGMYSEGITDNLLEAGIEIPYVIGVSMGTCVGSCYLSKQKGRNFDIAVSYVNDPRYISFRNLFTQGGIFGMDFIFDEIAYKLHPFDFKTFEAVDQELVVGAMCCEDGGTDYFYKSDMTADELLTAMRASCSLPFISKKVHINGTPYLDGGVSDSIPFQKAFEDGCDKVIVVLTRDAAYERQPFSQHRIGSLFYKDYPAVIDTMGTRHIRYHESLRELEALERSGKALIIRPESPIELGRMEKDVKKLEQTYQMGYEQGKRMIETIKIFLAGTDAVLTDLSCIS